MRVHERPWEVEFRKDSLNMYIRSYHESPWESMRGGGVRTFWKSAPDTHFWGHLHFWGFLHFWGRLHFWIKSFSRCFLNLWSLLNTFSMMVISIFNIIQSYLHDTWSFVTFEVSQIVSSAWWIVSHPCDTIMSAWFVPICFRAPRYRGHTPMHADIAAKKNGNALLFTWLMLVCKIVGIYRIERGWFVGEISLLTVKLQQSFGWNSEPWWE